MTHTTATTVRQRWGDDLRMERHRQKLSQHDVAVAAGIRPATVSRAEAGTGSLDVYMAIARVLDLALSTQDVA